MQRYVCGFLFNDEGTKVALVRKKRPQWQASLLNAVGGKVESGESPYEAMVREAQEEMGVTVPWDFVTTLLREVVYSVDFYRHRSSELLTKVRTVTDEEIVVADTRPLALDTIPNLQWLVPMFLDRTILVPSPIYDIDGN